MTVSPAVRVAPWTLADLSDTPDDGQRYEIIDGSLLVSPPPGAPHSRIADRLHALLRAVVAPDLEVHEGTGVQLAVSVVVPDVLVVRSAAVDAGLAVLTPADVLLAAEIVSPSSVTMDRVTKPVLYAAAGIPTYWRVEPTEPAVYVYRLADGRYADPVVARGEEPLTLDWPAALRLRASDLCRPRTSTGD